MKSDIKVIKEYLNDNSETTDTAPFEQWFLENADTDEADALLRDLLVRSVTVDDSLARRGFEAFRNRTGADDRNSPPRKNRGFAGGSRFAKAASWLQRAAAAAVLPLAAFAVYLYAQSVQPREWIEVYAPAGETKTVLLPDNSTVRLNSCSKIIYPARFDRSERRVFLSGEAYANISKDKSVPFVVSAGDIDVRVYGTQFNISSYVEDSECEVALVEGSVEIVAKSGGTPESVLLKPGEIVKYDKLTGRIDRHNFIPGYYRPAVDGGGFQFVNQRLSDIAAQLGRHFDVRIVIEQKSLGDERYYASFINNEDLEQILETLNAQNYMNIRYHGDVILISAR